jgi:CheY-like chemotaxis protein
VAATRAIRALSGKEKIPILALTANAFAEDREKCIQAGMNDFLTKPLDPDLLLERLQHWLSQSTEAA